MAKTCNNCGTENENVLVPYIVHESTMARNEREKKRLWIALIVSMVAIFLCNMAWIGAWTSYDYVSEETIYEQDGQGTNIIGDSNKVNDGTETHDTEAEED